MYSVESNFVPEIELYLNIGELWCQPGTWVMSVRSLKRTGLFGNFSQKADLSPPPFWLGHPFSRERKKWAILWKFLGDFRVKHFLGLTKFTKRSFLKGSLFENAFYIIHFFISKLRLQNSTFGFVPHENRMSWREQSILKVSLITRHLLHRGVFD